MSLPDRGMAFLDEHLAALNAGRRFPLHGQLELTWRCNFQCLHCYLQGGRDSLREMRTAEIGVLLDQMAAAGCLNLTLTGGEPLLRGDFGSILAQAVEAGFLVSLFTNASLVDGERAAMLRDHPPKLVDVTLYGASEESYQRITGDGANFGAVLAGIDRLLDDGHEVKLKAMLLAPLAHEAEAMLELARARGLGLRFDAMVDPTLRGDRRPTALRLPPERAVELLTLDPDRRERLVEFCAQHEPDTQSAAQGTCGAGHTAFTVDPAGRVSPCLLVREPAIDALSLGFDAAWAQLGQAPRVSFDPASPCRQCDMARLCSHCPGHEGLGESPPEKGDFYACQLSMGLQNVLKCKKPGNEDHEHE